MADWGWDKIDAISQTTFSNGFSWIKMHEFPIKFHWNLFLRFKLTTFQHWFRWWLGADQMTSHYLDQWWLVYGCIYVSLGINELTKLQSTFGHGWVIICRHNLLLRPWTWLVEEGLVPMGLLHSTSSKVSQAAPTNNNETNRFANMWFVCCNAIL